MKILFRGRLSKRGKQETRGRKKKFWEQVGIRQIINVNAPVCAYSHMVYLSEKKTLKKKKEQPRNTHTQLHVHTHNSHAHTHTN